MAVARQRYEAEGNNQAVFLLKDAHGEEVWYTDGERALIAWESQPSHTNAALYCGRSSSTLRRIR